MIQVHSVSSAEVSLTITQISWTRWRSLAVLVGSESSLPRQRCSTRYSTDQVEGLYRNEGSSLGSSERTQKGRKSFSRLWRIQLEPTKLKTRTWSLVTANSFPKFKSRSSVPMEEKASFDFSTSSHPTSSMPRICQRTPSTTKTSSASLAFRHLPVNSLSRFKTEHSSKSICSSDTVLSSVCAVRSFQLS